MDSEIKFHRWFKKCTHKHGLVVENITAANDVGLFTIWDWENGNKSLLVMQKLKWVKMK